MGHARARCGKRGVLRMRHTVGTDGNREYTLRDKRPLCRYHRACRLRPAARVAPALVGPDPKECSDPVMKCQICGRQSLPGAKLCLDCKAARKRAFDATVTQPLLAAAGAARGSTVAPRLLKASQSVPAGARRAAKMALAAQAQSSMLIESPPLPAGGPSSPVRYALPLSQLATSGTGSGGSKSDTFAAVTDERPVTQDEPATSIVRALDAGCDRRPGPRGPARCGQRCGGRATGRGDQGGRRQTARAYGRARTRRR